MKLLMVLFSNWDDHVTFRLKLFGQVPRDALRSTGDEDAVEWRFFRPSVVAIAESQVDI